MPLKQAKAGPGSRLQLTARGQGDGDCRTPQAEKRLVRISFSPHLAPFVGPFGFDGDPVCREPFFRQAGGWQKGGGIGRVMVFPITLQNSSRKRGEFYYAENHSMRMKKLRALF